MTAARVQLYANVNPYPAPRASRGSGIPQGGGPPSSVPVPESFTWAGHVRNAGADTLAVVTSKRIRGPAFLDVLEWIPQLGAGTTRSPKFIFGWSLSDVAEGNDLTDAALAQVSPLVEQDFRDDGGFSAAGLAGLYHTNAAATTRHTQLRRAIQAPEFFLVAAVRTDAAAGAFIVDFTLRVLENVAPDLLAELVTS